MSGTFLFARHGNTFAPGDKVVWVGRETDLPLVARGEEQAAELAAALAAAGLIPDLIFCAGLRRTRHTAEIVAAQLGLAPPRVEPRLDELDYGAWAGRGNDEILAADPAAAAAMAAWNERDEWPDAAGWLSRRPAVMAELAGLAADLAAVGGRPLVVSSNGILRFLPRLMLAAPPAGSLKMKTGHAGAIADGRLLGWDLPPAALGQLRVQE